MTAVQETTLVTDPPVEVLEDERPQGGGDAAAAARAMIVFENVHKVYELRTSSRSRSASFVIEKGEFVFLVGPSGSGKSMTMVRLLLKGLEPTSGRIVVEWSRLARLRRSKVAQLRRNIGVSSGLQAPAEPHDLGERRLCAEGAGREPQLDPAQGAGGAQHGRPRRRRTPTPTSSRAESSSASRSRAPSSTIRRCSSATSRLESLDPDTSVGIMQLLYRINRSGTTVVMATHDREMVDKMRRA